MYLTAPTANPLLSAWQIFYEIVGSSAGALIGVQFVVIALIANLRARTNPESIGAFGTPTVVHFGGALAVAAIMSAPWPSLLGIRVALALCGVGGLAYSAVVYRRARRQTVYKPVAEDWVWYVVVPCGIYAALTVAAVTLRTTTQIPPFVIGGAALGLLLVGIHNAWDTVTHIVTERPQTDATKPD